LPIGAHLKSPRRIRDCVFNPKANYLHEEEGKSARGTEGDSDCEIEEEVDEARNEEDDEIAGI
jgi:hypothetical protein